MTLTPAEIPTEGAGSETSTIDVDANPTEAVAAELMVDAAVVPTKTYVHVPLGMDPETVEDVWGTVDRHRVPSSDTEVAYAPVLAQQAEQEGYLLELVESEEAFALISTSNVIDHWLEIEMECHY